ncbi:MAG: type II toxin-antitoxin system HicB family antitoxin [Nitrospirae bacterium]|nr:type II toxin-antitoxin system HicB family antitoxin [Nitrospirota bacterium]MBF0618116.1 type II toxin-antitoxin system HicB family antitoxin [Nitrospirota bacterium]
MIRLQYPAVVTYIEEDNDYLVEFPDLKGCITDGETIEQALFNAKEALTGYLAVVFERDHSVPEASDLKGDNIYLVEPEPKVSIPIFLRKLRQEQGLSQSDLAQRLGITYQVYQRLENTVKSNPTVKTLTKIANAFHKQLHVEII